MDVYPETTGHTPPVMAPSSGDGGVCSVLDITEAKLEVALDRLRARNTAPGLDGIPGQALVIPLEYLGGRLRELFNFPGQFLKAWKDGRLCLLRKEGRPVDSASAYKPIVLLDEMGKLFERILSARLVHHLEEVGPGLSDDQFGFRAERSTIDALRALKDLTEEVASEGDIVHTVSLDVANAFNSLPFETVVEALRYHGVSPYLRVLLRAYLQDREVL